jgi:hypothetical protein
VSAAEVRSPAVVVGAVYATAMAAVAAVAAWPIYEGGMFVAVVAASVVAALAIGSLTVAFDWPRWRTALVAFAAFVAIGLSLAAPPTGFTPLELLIGLRDLFLGAVTGWKDLVTVDLPVGGYRNLLVPALVVFLAGTLTTFLLGRRTGGIGALGALTGVGMTAFGLLFGRTVTSDPLVLGPVVIPAPREILVGVLALVLTVMWLAWRAQEQRRDALRRAAATSGVRVSRRRSGSDTRRAGLAAGMLVIAVTAGAVAAPMVAQGSTRDVLRSGASPELDIRDAVSPLADYRSHFTDAAVDAPLFSVTSVSGRMPDRIRLATLASYDGAVFSVSDDDATGDRFIRVPSELDGGSGEQSEVRIRISGLRGIWLPTFGSLEQLQFTGTDAASLADAFYYDASAQAAVDTADRGLRSGDTYTVRAVTAAAPSLSQVTAPGAHPQVDIPASLKTWVKDQNAGTGGAALQTLVDRLRERGYLSHALSVPADGATWEKQLGTGYAFQPSAAGHSLARIDELFQQLLQRQASVSAQTPGASLVSGIGDDEQFAVATALMAEQLGFPARIVVGARLDGDSDTAACTAGVCRGGDIAAWVEVLSSAGQWVTVDATPQHENAVDDKVARERDPENPTDVTPETAKEVVPPDPVQRDADQPADRSDSGFDLGTLWAALRIVALVALGILIVLGPFAAIVVAKAIRRRGRRDAQSAASRVVGGWDEYVDAAVDHGRTVPRAGTRSELASSFASQRGAALAETADRAVFSDDAISAEESDEFWRIVDDERERFSAGSPWWRRALAAVSLRSFTRGLAPRLPRVRSHDSRRTERRGRRRDGDAR